MLHEMVVHQAGGLFDISPLLSGAGPWLLVIVAVIVFIETGLLFPFLPGDTLLFAAALVAPAAGVPLWLLVVVAAATAIVGDQVGYLLGRRLGRRLFKPDARILKTRYLERADEFFERYGPFSLVLARFVPIVRTYVPPLVGTSQLRYRTFLIWNAVGGLGWAIVIAVAGTLLGHIAFVSKNLDIIAVLIAALSLIPVAITLLRERRASRAKRAEQVALDDRFR
ncbi:MAG: rane-associated protein [Microbacteriaceae bacterium]|nr:alkaline phosphatase [Microbacteriaceae bacterium]MDQ1527047.1 rane-associated protein [Microbacteriaceae bacterium]MDQ1605926.1 rane-associated protein [Microbacteriaceae bacterium]